MPAIFHQTLVRLKGSSTPGIILTWNGTNIMQRPSPGDHKVGESTDVYLSCVSEDAETARELARRLEADGFSVWLGEDHLLPGVDVWHEIETAIQDTRFFLLLVSSSYGKKYADRELEMAVQRWRADPEGLTIIPVRLEADAPVPAPLEPLLHVDYFKGGFGGYDFLVRGLRKGSSPERTPPKPNHGAALSQEGASLIRLRLDQIGMSKQLVYEPDERLNIITGDNSLGKTFILECMFWALTGQWLELPAMPRRDADKDAPRITFAVGRAGAESSGHEARARYDWEKQTWDLGRSAIRLSGLLVYARHDGSFAIWDPLRTSPTGHSSDPGEPMHLFLTRGQVRDGLPSTTQRDESRWLCNGLLRDWVSWQRGGPSQQSWPFDTLTSSLQILSPPDSMSLSPGEPVRLPGDTREIPTLSTPYGNVPLLHLSAGMQRIVSLAYMLIWTWQEHLALCELARREPLGRLLLMIDEVEAHLHPRWQRAIVPALMHVIEKMSSEIRPQIHLATHSPLVLASAEEIFDEELDQLFNLRLDGADVALDRQEFVRFGTVDGWLTSEAFGLDHPRSQQAASAIDDAKELQESEQPSPDRVREVHGRLVEALASNDEFWPRWRYFALQHGVER
jgi:TIR domain/AAA domain, putative AbiEii toxin, Type IV TA system/AAA domain